MKLSYDRATDSLYVLLADRPGVFHQIHFGHVFPARGSLGRDEAAAARNAVRNIHGSGVDIAINLKNQLLNG